MRNVHHLPKLDRNDLDVYVNVYVGECVFGACTHSFIGMFRWVKMYQSDGFGVYTYRFMYVKWNGIVHIWHSVFMFIVCVCVR